MPELPEVETVVRTLRPHVLDCRITGARLLRAACLHPLSLPPACLTGCRVTAADRRGKLALLRLDTAQAEAQALRATPELVLVAHLRMTGSLLAHPCATAPGPYTRCLLDMRGARGPFRVFFDDVRAFGQLLVCAPPTLERWPFWRDLGPEPLELDATALAGRLAGRRAALKAVLLDQKTLAGVGNIYADESLFAARLDPRRPADSLAPEEVAALLASLQDVLRRAIDQCGSSIRNYRDANGNAGAFQNSFAVYGRGGKPCPRCGRPLHRLRVAGRGTVCCPRCQR